MKFTREQELYLVNLGIQKLVDDIIKNPNQGIDREVLVKRPRKYKKRKKTMTAAQKRVLSKRMKEVWAAKRLNK